MRRLSGFLLDFPNEIPRDGSFFFFASDPQHLVYLAVHYGHRDVELGRVVGEHDDGVRVGHRLHELVESDREVRDDEEKRPDTATQFRPLPQILSEDPAVVEELDSGDGSPHHGEDKGAIHRSYIHHHAVQSGQQEHVYCRCDNRTYCTHVQFQRPHVKGPRVQKLRHGESRYPVDEEPVIFQNQKYVAQGWEHQTDEDLPRVRIRFTKVHTVQQDEYNERGDR